jgi:cytochrome b pre-mRNA-processing protein 3
MPFRSNADRRRRERAAAELYASMVAQARQPYLYAGLGVADSVDGRFDSLVAHAFLLMRRLGAAGAGDEARLVSQALFDLMFADMDQSLREMGVSDLSVGKKIKQMVEAFYGRVSAYETALGDSLALADAVARNLFRGAPPSPQAALEMAAYMARQAAHLDAQATQALLEGRAAWLAPEAAP